LEHIVAVLPSVAPFIGLAVVLPLLLRVIPDRRRERDERDVAVGTTFDGIEAVTRTIRARAGRRAFAPDARSSLENAIARYETQRPTLQRELAQHVVAVVDSFYAEARRLCGLYEVPGSGVEILLRGNKLEKQAGVALDQLTPYRRMRRRRRWI